MTETKFSFDPIAYVRTKSKFKFEAPRQAAFSGVGAFIEFLSDPRFAVAAADLAGFERIWVIFVFHENYGRQWKPKTRPPLSPDGARYGVFATRSPHRPNPVGISCVKLLSVEKNGLAIANSDMLDGTPVIDIKPYIPEADAFPDSAAGWRDALDKDAWTLRFAAAASARAEWIAARAGLDLRNFCEVQLKYEPFDSSRKRVAKIDAESNLYSVGCRTWRIVFRPDSVSRTLEIITIESNYAPEELAPGSPDPYSDKAFHREFADFIKFMKDHEGG